MKKTCTHSINQFTKIKFLFVFCRSHSERPEKLLSCLWPFFHHALPSVREAALSTAITMLGGDEQVGRL